MTSIVTTNALTDFDLCLALAQTSIDTQMEYAWKAWKRRANFKDTIDVFKLKEDGQLLDTQYGISATFAPLTIGLNVPDAKSGQVQVNLLLKSGKVVYYDQARDRKAECPIDNWSITFVTDLDKRPVDLRMLQQIDPDASKVAQDLIQSTGLPESVFSIEYLFLKLTEVDLMLADNKNVKIPATVPSSARDRALGSLNLLLQGQLGEYLFGTVVRRNTKQATPTFALTDFVFDVSSNWSVATASTLNYLGELAGRGMPADTSRARATLRDAWVRPEQLDGRESNVSGIMAISKAVFLEKYFIPKMQQALRGLQFPDAMGVGYGVVAGYMGPTPQSDGKSWTFSEERSGGTEVKGFIRMLYSATQGYQLTLTPQPSTNKVLISGSIWSRVHYDGMTWLAPDIGNHTEWIYVDGHQPISGSVDLSGNGIATDFNLDSNVVCTIGDAVVDRNEVGGFSNVTEAFGKAFKAIGIASDTPGGMIGTIQRQLGEVVRGQIQAALERLDMDLKQQTFIPPGGGVFTFQNPAFSPAADLFLDVIYRAP